MPKQFSWREQASESSDETIVTPLQLQYVNLILLARTPWLRPLEDIGTDHLYLA